MEIITGYTGKPHVTSEQDRDVNIGVVGEGSYVLRTGMQLAAEVSSNNEIKNQRRRVDASRVHSINQEKYI